MELRHVVVEESLSLIRHTLQHQIALVILQGEGEGEREHKPGCIHVEGTLEYRNTIPSID